MINTFPKKFDLWPAVIMVLSWIGLAVAYLFYGRIFLDAGFYLDAAYRVWHGQWPYKDFFYVQGPVYPYVYGAIMRMTGVGVISGRLISLSLGILTFVFVYKIASKLGYSPISGFWAILLLVGAPTHAYYFSSIKLYALAGFFLTGAVYFLIEKNKPSWRYLMAIVWVILASGTRLTLLPAIGVVYLYIALKSFPEHKKIFWITTGTGIVTGIVLSVPFLVQDIDAVFYNLIGIHTSAHTGPYVFGWKAHLRVLLKTAVAYAAVVLGLLAGCMSLMKKHLWRKEDIPGAVILILITVVHFSANWFSVGYQSVVMPIGAALAGGWLGRAVTDGKHQRFFGMLTALMILTSSVLTAKDPIWHGPGTALGNIRQIGSFLKRKVTTSGKIGTCNAVLVYEADRLVMEPFGGAPFTFTPRWDEKTCRRYGGINESMLIRLIHQKKAAAWILQKDSFSVGFPGFFLVSDVIQHRIFDALKMSYREAARFPDLGNGDDDLIVFLPKGLKNERHFRQ